MNKTFDNPKKLGLLRGFEIFFAVTVLLNVLSLILIAKSNITFTVDILVYFLEVVAYGVMFWLIYQRKKITRIFIPIGIAVFVILRFIILSINAGEPAFINMVEPGFLFEILAIIYFLTSKRVKAQLNQTFSASIRQEEAEEREALYQPKKWSFWRNLIIYFCVFSVVGHWMEAGFCLLVKYGILSGTYDPNSQIWSDWFYPFCVYGAGAVACILIMFPIKNFIFEKTKKQIPTLIISFIVNAFICTLIEFVMGLIMNHPDPVTGNLQLWDYSDMAFNFMGQVCLQNAIAFGLVATLMVWVFYPMLERFLKIFSKDIMNIIFVVVCVFFSILMAMYLINAQIPDVDIRLGGNESGISQEIPLEGLPEESQEAVPDAKVSAIHEIDWLAT